MGGKILDTDFFLLIHKKQKGLTINMFRIGN